MELNTIVTNEIYTVSGVTLFGDYAFKANFLNKDYAMYVFNELRKCLDVANGYIIVATTGELLDDFNQ